MTSMCGRSGACAFVPVTAGRGSRTLLSRERCSSPAPPGRPAIESYPVDNKGAKVDLTMAYVGTRRLFEHAGFVKVADTESVLNGFPRVVMRLDLG